MVMVVVMVVVGREGKKGPDGKEEGKGRRK
jgi:hypothetical protein